MSSFVAIDFETATSQRDSICSVGIVTVKDGEITEEYHALIQPPYNIYDWNNIQVHGITEEDTKNAPFFNEVYPEIHKRLANKRVVAHNESFDRGVLKASMEAHNLSYKALNIGKKWECTMRIYRAKGYKPAKLDYCSARNNIELIHHDALSDARACAKLYLLTDQQLSLFF